MGRCNLLSTFWRINFNQGSSKQFRKIRTVRSSNERNDVEYSIRARRTGGRPIHSQNRITTYQAPPSCRRLPLLSVGLKQLLECQELMLDDWRLRYKPFAYMTRNATRLPFYGPYSPFFDGKESSSQSTNMKIFSLRCWPHMKGVPDGIRMACLEDSKRRKVLDACGS